MRVSIVGAGPTGLFLAVALARRGHPVELIDRDPGPVGSAWPRRGVMQFDHPHAFRNQVCGALVTELSDVFEELLAAVRETIGAVAALKRVDVVSALPKTRSGKILRKTMRGIADGRDEPVPSTIEDAGVLDALTPILRS